MGRDIYYVLLGQERGDYEKFVFEKGIGFDKIEKDYLDKQCLKFYWLFLVVMGGGV